MSVFEKSEITVSPQHLLKIYSAMEGLGMCLPYAKDIFSRATKMIFSL